jgi:phosphoribosylformylglycinamidine synthase subunit PurQ / glutaminase
MSARVGVVVFPGSNCEQDVVHALDLLGAAPEYVWHHTTDLTGFDAIVLPGGFAYGDYLRTGALAAFSPVMEQVRDFAAGGGPVLGICNGFQVLCEAGLLPGALRRNAGLKFICREVAVRVATAGSPFTSECAPGQVLRIPINHFEGNYYCPREVLAELEAEDRVAFRYCAEDGEARPGSNPNGAIAAIAGVLSKDRNVCGMMPHPERATDPEVGGVDGARVFRSLLNSLSPAGASVG